MVAPGFVWAYLDYHVWPWDQAQYGEVTLRNLGAFEQGIITGIASMGVSLDFKAPGLTWLGVPYAILGRFMDRPEPALLGATLTWQIGTLLACLWSAYLVSRSRLVAVAVTAFIGSTPLFIGMNHEYLVEPLQAFAVALSFLLALRARAMSGEAILIALCGISALAMAAKASSPLYCTLPLAYATYVLASRGSLTQMQSLRLIRLPLLLLATVSLISVCWWYVSHFDATFQNVKQATVGSFALNYGTQADFSAKLWYWTSEFASALVSRSPFLLLAAAAGACGGLASQWRRAHAFHAGAPSSDAPAAGPARWVVGAAAIHLGAAFITYSLQINEDTRFLEPLLPASAILLAWLCSRRWLVLISSALLATAVADFVLVYSYALGLSTPTGVQHPSLRVVERDDSRRRQMQTIVALTCDPERPYAVNIIGVDYAWLSQFSANFYAAAAQGGRPACQYTSLGYAVKDVDRAVETLIEVPHRYFIGLRPERMPPWPDFLNRASAAVFAKVGRSEQWEQVLTIHDTVVIFRSKRGYGMALIHPAAP